MRRRDSHDGAVAMVTPDGSDQHAPEDGDKTDSQTEYHGEIQAPCHIWAGYISMRIIRQNISQQLMEVPQRSALHKIAHGIFTKWSGLPRVKAVFDGDGHEIAAVTPVTGLFSREHDWDKHYDAVDDRVYVTHITGKEEVATVAVSRGQNCLITVVRHGEPSVKLVGTMARYVDRAVLVDSSWLRGHMMDVVLKNSTRLSNLFDEKIESEEIKEEMCPRAVMDARIQDAVINGSPTKSAVDLTLFSNLDAGTVSVKVSKTVHIQVANGCGELHGTVVSTDARLRRIVTAYVQPNTGKQTLNLPEHCLIARWLVLLIYVLLKHMVQTKSDHVAQFARYDQILTRHKWAIPMLLHIVGCDVHPNLLPAVGPSKRSYVRMVEDNENGRYFLSTNKHTAVALGVQCGEFKFQNPNGNPSTVVPGTAGIGVVPVGHVCIDGGVHCLNCSDS
mmetsp:Transcript_3861/g.9908  ORF Transcript_3861/g.9908 Transcript_3861/m.9908 type:complete len:446 (-) Transcript_3861:187-1524(-)